MSAEKTPRIARMAMWIVAHLASITATAATIYHVVIVAVADGDPHHIAWSALATGMIAAWEHPRAGDGK